MLNIYLFKTEGQQKLADWTIDRDLGHIWYLASLRAKTDHKLG